MLSNLCPLSVLSTRAFKAQSWKRFWWSKLWTGATASKYLHCSTSPPIRHSIGFTISCLSTTVSGRRTDWCRSVTLLCYFSPRATFLQFLGATIGSSTSCRLSQTTPRRLSSSKKYRSSALKRLTSHAIWPNALLSRKLACWLSVPGAEFPCHCWKMTSSCPSSSRAWGPKAATNSKDSVWCIEW